MDHGSKISRRAILRNFVLMSSAAFLPLSLVSCPDFGAVYGPPPVDDYDQLHGTWLISSFVSDEYSYIVFDGYGQLVDVGFFIDYPSGNYSFFVDGSFSGTIVDGGANNETLTFTGQLSSDSTGSLTIASGETHPIRLVNNPASLEGSWQGTLTENSPSTATYQIWVTVDSRGQIISLAGFADPILRGAIFSENGKVAGYISNSEVGEYNKISLTGTLLNEVNIQGTYEIDNGEGVDGTYIFTKM